MKKLLFLTIIPLLLLVAAPVAAVEYGGIGAAPANPDPANPRTQAIFVYSLKPGESKTDGVKVYNNTAGTKTIAVYAVDSQTSSGGSLACAQKVEAKKDVGAWVTLDQTEVTLESQQSEVIPFTLAVPDKASVGEHDGCLVVQEAAPASEAHNGIALSFRSALRMVVTIPGDIHKKLSFTAVTYQPGKNNTEIITPHLRNEGNVSLDTDVTASLQTIFGGTIAHNGGSYPVLPNTAAEWNFEIKRPFWGGWYKVAASATYGTDVTKPLGTKGGPQATIHAPTTFVWITPRPTALLAELFVVACVTGAVYWLLVRRRRIKQRYAGWVTYKVKARDTLNGLAEKHHINWKDLARANNIQPPYELTKGQEILVPPPEAQKE